MVVVRIDFFGNVEGVSSAESQAFGGGSGMRPYRNCLGCLNFVCLYR